MRAAITERTAAVFYVAGNHTQGALPLEQTVEIAHEAGVPVVVDAAARSRRCPTSGASAGTRVPIS